MPRRPRRSRQQGRTHVDRYASKAARSQDERRALDADWERRHPVVVAPPSTDQSSEQEDEEASA